MLLLLRWLVLGSFDLVLDDVLVFATFIRLRPPGRTLVFAIDVEMLAGAADRLALITLLPAKTTCEATRARAPMLPVLVAAF